MTSALEPHLWLTTVVLSRCALQASPIRRLALLLTLFWAPLALVAATLPPTLEGAARASPVLAIEDIGQGIVPIDGEWQFHLSDDMRWAAPSYDDSGWEQIKADKSWGAQTHSSYAGFAWYRRHLEITPSTGTKPKFAILMPVVEDAYELYWNGVKIGHLGTLPPNAVWYSSHRQSFALPLSPSGTGAGVLAVRVWKSALTSADSAYLGGMHAPPVVGEDASIAAAVGQGDFLRIRGRLYDSTINSVLLLLGAFSILSWLRNRAQWLYLWFGLWLLGQAALYYLWLDWAIELFSYPALFGLEQIIFSLQDCSLFLLLLYLFELQGDRRIRRWTLIAVAADLLCASADGIILRLWAHAGLTMQWADAAVSVVWDLAEVFVIVLVYQGLKRRLDTPRKLVALTASLVYLYGIVRYLSKEGLRFTHWTLFDKLNTPLFHLAGSAVTTPVILDTLLLGSLTYALVRYAAREREKETAIENELKSAGEVQHVMIPEVLPEVPGYAITSAYHPAQQVGGDFFQIIPLTDAATLIVLGDVSGKGLKAAMNVALIIGTLRTLAEFDSDPQSILAGLNRRLVGRMQGGFTTAIVLKLDSSGHCTLANAGHLPPFLNRNEFAVNEALPLGIVDQAEFIDQHFTLRDSDCLTLYTDGVPEARDEKGELYGFDRTYALLCDHPFAESVALAARNFGQEDDITVLTIKFLPASERASSPPISLAATA